MNILISATIGALITIMILFNGVLSENVGNYTSSVIIHIIGLAPLIILVIFNKIKLKIHTDIPLYLYSAGAIGVFTVLFTNISFSKLGVSITIALGLLGQSLSSIIIDHFGLLDMKTIRFNKKKLIGLIFIISGIIIMAIF